jgi:Fe-S cluster biogenesis protein NfuA
MDKNLNNVRNNEKGELKEKINNEINNKNLEELKKEVEKVLEEIIPYLASHGGGIELVDVTKDGVVKVRLIGACMGCIYSNLTLKGLVEQELKEKLPWVKEVIDITLEEIDFEPTL